VFFNESIVLCFHLVLFLSFNSYNELVASYYATLLHAIREVYKPYVYWTVHHLYSCVKRKNQLDATYFII